MFDVYHSLEWFTLLGQGMVITCIKYPQPKARDNFASSMIKEDIRVGSCINDLYLIPEQ